MCQLIANGGSEMRGRRYPAGAFHAAGDDAIQACSERSLREQECGQQTAATRRFDHQPAYGCRCLISWSIEATPTLSLSTRKPALQALRTLSSASRSMLPSPALAATAAAAVAAAKPCRVLRSQVASDRPAACAARSSSAISTPNRAAAAHGLVAARAESLMPRTAQDDHPDVRIELRLVGGIDQLADRFRSKGIASVGPIDDNAGDAFGEFVANIGVGLAGGTWLPGESGADHGDNFIGKGDGGQYSRCQIANSNCRLPNDDGALAGWHAAASGKPSASGAHLFRGGRERCIAGYWQVID